MPSTPVVGGISAFNGTAMRLMTLTRLSPMCNPRVVSEQRTYSLGVLGGDGIGPDVIEQALRVLDVVCAGGPTFERTQYDLGARRWHASGQTLPDDVLEQLRQHDVLLLGAVGDPSVPSGVLERGLLLRLRFAFDHCVNLRPSRLLPGVRSPLADPGEVDLVVVREGTEGPYLGNGGVLRPGTAAEVATEVSLNTAFGVERVVRDAFARAKARPRRRLTLVHKDNVLNFAGDLWRRTLDRVGLEFPEVSTDYLHVDAATIVLVTEPSRLDVVVTDNLFGDILTDLAAAVTGGIGLAASANIDPSGKAPSLFEPVHGSAPDLVGTGRADPTAAIRSVAMMLEHLGLSGLATQIEAAVASDLAERYSSGPVPPRSTHDVGSAIVGQLRG